MKMKASKINFPKTDFFKSGFFKRKQIKAAFLSTICATAAILSPSVEALAQETSAIPIEALAQGKSVLPIEVSNASQNSKLSLNGQSIDNGIEKKSSQSKNNAEQNPNGQAAEAQNPGDLNSNAQQPDNQNPDAQNPDSQQPDNQSPDAQNPDAQQPDNQNPEENNPSQDAEQKPDSLKITAKASAGKNKASAKISWKKTGEGKVASFLVQRSDSRNGNYKTLAHLAAGKSYTDKKVKSANRYYYRVAAKTKNGNVFYSNACQFQCPVDALPGVRLVRYSTSSIKVMWDKSKNKKADWYKVYYSKSKAGKYKLAGVTKNTWYRVRGLKNNQVYYFGVKACTTKKTSGFDSKLSKISKMRTTPYERTTIFAGDSITTGLSSYNILNEIAIGGRKSVVAAIGLNTMTFRTRKVFNGRSGTESIVAAKPYRVYIMLGDNDIHYRNKNDLIDGYREIVRAIKAGSPGTDIVILAASPVTAAEASRRKGFAQIPAYNQSLCALAKEMGVKYYDCTGFLKDSTGWLKSSYNAGDGVHWQPAAYHEYARRLTAYDKSLD